MSDGIPVLIHLDAETFRHIERAAQRKGVTMRVLIEAGLKRSTQPRPTHVHGQVPSPSRERGLGNRMLTDAEWAELKQLKATGWRVPELAVRFGCSSSTIYFRLRREQKQQ